MQTTDYLLGAYLKARPIFLSVLRGKEAALYQHHFPFKHRVLDVGCGDGFFARVAFGQQKIDVGIDMEESRIDEAKISGAYKSVVSYDGRHIPFRDRSFQAVVINSVLEHTDDVARVVSEMHRVLAAGGTCYATVMALPWEQHLFGVKIFGDAYARWMKKKQVHINLFSYTQWKAVFRKAGFHVVSMTPYLSPRAAAWLDILHYISIPSLFCYAINRRWVWWPAITNWYPLSFFSNLMEESVNTNQAGALFFVLKRP